MFDFTAIGKLKQLWADFKKNNPDVLEMVNKVQAKGFCEKQRFIITVKYPDGTEFNSDLEVTKDDLQLLNSLEKLKF